MKVIIDDLAGDVLCSASFVGGVKSWLRPSAGFSFLISICPSFSVTAIMVAQQNPLSFPAAAVGRAHTILAAAAFTSALCIGSLLHYKKLSRTALLAIRMNGSPLSQPRRIGDWYPERNIFQILIAVTSVPRFILVALQYYLHRSRTSSLPALVFIFGLIRTISCGGWVYITSSDDHDIHDIMMITYMVCNIPWMIGGIRATPLKSSVVRRKRTYIATVFFVTIIPLIYYFIQHKIYRIPGAYTRYAFFEWGLIFSDILYDSVLSKNFGKPICNLVSGLGREGDNVGYQAIVTGLGLMVSALAKHANHSNNPGISGHLSTQRRRLQQDWFDIALISVFVIYTRQHRRISPFTPPGRSRASDITPPWFTSGISLGSLLFTAHNLLADPSTLVAWSWTGFTNGHPRGPVPHVHGFLTLIAQSIGILAPLILPSLDANPLASPVWFLYGAGSAYVMYMYRNWLGYVGSLNHALFLMSIFPLVLQKAADTEKVARTYTTAMLVYCLLNLASIFTAAYAFVPGGQIFREHTDLVTIGKWLAYRLHSAPPTANQARLLVSVYRLPSTAPKPYKPGPRVINAGIWTIHFGFDNIGHDSQRGVRNLVKDMQLDIVGLLETDLHRTAFGHRDLTRVIVEEGYNVDIGPGPNSHTWGCVLLTKFPIINTTHHLLPSPHGELAPAIEAVLDVYGTPITVVVSHNGQEEDALDRELQSRKLAEIMSASHHPVIFLGYVVTKPHAQRPNPYEIMVKDGNVHDIDHEDLDRWCEYIFYRGLYRTAYARISRGIITDTEMQVGQFVLPKYGYGVAGQSVEARYLRARKEDLPVAHWFPMEYYGSPIRGGVDGHFYHVFGTPLYYKLPETAIV
ncbi:Frag1/DRAM/Sfk1 family-domain-containing protein [Cyathus striatus]|nr:Frag1/DRAM/Sfk1 family-domain-containing protein [Cyathus striatus]